MGEFHRDKRKSDGRCVWCKACACDASRQWNLANNDRAKETAKKRYRKMPEVYKRKAKEWAELNPEMRKRVVKKHDLMRRIALKIEVMEAYGGCKCACCGESELFFLTIDHMANDGAAHRKQVHSLSLYVWLMKNSFPPGFQVLCRNCNWGKHANGGVCPHQNKVATDGTPEVA